MTDHSKGIIITIFAVLFIIPDSLFIRLLSADIYTIIVWRSFISGFFILLGLCIYHGSNIFNIYRNIGKNSIIFACLLAISGPMFALSVSMTAVSNTVYILASMPIFSAISSWFILNEKISKRMLWTILFSLSGVLLISYGSSQNQSTSIYGDLCAVGCAASYGVALTYARKSKAKSMIPITPFALFMSGVVFLPWASPFVFNNLDAQYALFHNLLIAASTCLIVVGPRYIPSAEVTLLILGESILAPILIWLIIGEYPGTWTLTGGFIVLMTLFISNLIALMHQKSK